MVTIEILSDLNGAPLGRTEHQEPTPKAAQEWAAHWTHEVVKGGFIPEGAYVTYVIIGDDGTIIDIVAYLHTSEAEVTTE